MTLLIWFSSLSSEVPLPSVAAAAAASRLHGSRQLRLTGLALTDITREPSSMRETTADRSVDRRTVIGHQGDDQ